MSNYFYCRIPPKGMLSDTKRDLLAIAKFFLVFLLHTQYMYKCAIFMASKEAEVSKSIQRQLL